MRSSPFVLIPGAVLLADVRAQYSTIDARAPRERHARRLHRSASAALR